MAKIVRSVLCGLFVVLLAGSYAIANDELEYVKQAIAAKGGRWHAQENNVSRLSHEERRMKLGLIKTQMPDAPHVAAPAASQSTVAAVPGTLDWRNYNGGNWVTPVRNQGNCGSCWAFATAANLESATLIKNGTPFVPGADLDLSEQILVSCGGAGSCSGGSPGAASNYIKNTGLPQESVYPYTATNGTCPSWQAPAYKISGWSYVATTAPTVDAIKNALNTYGPVNTTMEVYSDFFYYTSGIYHYATGTYQGGHAVLIVGYNDNEQSFTVKNSWSTGWGEAGYFRIGYSELNSVTQFGDYTIAYQAGSAPPPPPPSCTYSISTANASYPASGGKGNVSVTAGAGCGWTASAGSAGWVTITSGASGSGNGTVGYSVAPNTSTATRSANLTIAGKTFNVTQAAAAQTYTITATAGSNGTISPSGAVSVASGASQNFKITPAAGYKIANVIADGSSLGVPNNVTFNSVRANHTISASFTAVTSYTLTVSKNGTGSGTVTSSPPGPTYNSGTYVTLTAAAGANSTFAGWSGACSGTSRTCTVAMTRNTAVTATFNSARSAR